MAIPLFKYLGSKTKAVNTMATAAKTSYATIGNPSLKDTPFTPTICSVERFVNNNEPAMIGPVKLLPPKK